MNNVSIDQLHDIVLPQAPGLWPLAVGWWLLIALVIVVITFSVIHVKSHLNQWQVKRLALSKLSQCSDTNDINQLLKQVAIHYFPTINVASLTGKHWACFINENLSEQSTQKLLEINNALYTPHHAEHFDHYQEIAKQWLLNLNKRALLEIPHANF